MTRKQDDARDPVLKGIVEKYEELSGDTSFLAYVSYPVERGAGRYVFQGAVNVCIGVDKAIEYAQKALDWAQEHKTAYRPFG